MVPSPLPFDPQAHQAEREGLGDSALELQACLGLAWALGCGALGLLVVRNSAECRIARQYLCQACAFVSGLAILALTAVQGYRGYLLFVWVRRSGKRRDCIENMTYL